MGFRELSQFCYTVVEGRTSRVGESPLFYWLMRLGEESMKRNEIGAHKNSGQAQAPGQAQLKVAGRAVEKAAGQTKAQVSAQAIIEKLADAIAARTGLEIVEVELKGAGRNQLLRITIDKLANAEGEGVTHTDCETVSREVSEALDAEDPIVGPYSLEVTSPGVERKLKKWQDWERFKGKKVKVLLKEPAGDLKHFDGAIARTAEDRSVTVELPDGAEVTFPFEQVDRANLKFEW